MISINLRPVNKENVWDIIELKADEKLVATNAESLAEAYATYITNEIPPLVYAIYNEEIAVGFAMVQRYRSEDETEIMYNQGVPFYYLWRLMIDEKYQNKGYGRKAMALIFDEVKTKKPLGEANAFYTSVVMEEVNPVGVNFYLSLGFAKTGEVIDPEGENEQILRLEL